MKKCVSVVMYLVCLMFSADACRDGEQRKDCALWATEPQHQDARGDIRFLGTWGGIRSISQHKNSSTRLRNSQREFLA
jgi:hypothetical protein